MDAEPSPREIMTAVLDLHGAVANGFAMVEGRLDRVEGRLDRVEVRLDRVEGRLDRVEARLGRVEARLDHVETQLTSIGGEVAGLQRWRLTVDGRLDRLEQAYYR